MLLLSTRLPAAVAKGPSALTKTDMLELFRSTEFANTVQKVMESTIKKLSNRTKQAVVQCEQPSQ